MPSVIPSDGCAWSGSNFTGCVRPIWVFIELSALIVIYLLAISTLFPIIFVGVSIIVIIQVSFCTAPYQDANPTQGNEECKLPACHLVKPFGQRIALSLSGPSRSSNAL